MSTEEQRRKWNEASKRYLRTEKGNARRRAWRAKNPEAEKWYWMERQYGLTHEAYLNLVKVQEGCCGLCRKPLVFEGKNVFVDHNHQTGAVRGLLCLHCNTALGLLDEDTDRLRDAILYLEKPGTVYKVQHDPEAELASLLGA
jgi:hypothetical protein